MNSLQLDLFQTVAEHHFPSAPFEPETFRAGEYAVIIELGSFGYYYGERCYVHEVLEDGYRVEICEGLVWGRPWCKDGTMLEVPFSALGRYDAETHYRIGAHWCPTVEDMIAYRSTYDTRSMLI